MINKKYLYVGIVVFILGLILTIYNYEFSKYDINNMPKEQLLMKLSEVESIDRKLAIRIINSRPYHDINELDNISGIGDKRLNYIKKSFKIKEVKKWIMNIT